jgi:glycosyltransferase involved in cell wall biosynthesis
MDVTIAICTFNRCALLRQTLTHLTKIPVPADLAWQVLVVDNNCTDQTAAVVGEFQGRLPIASVFEPKPGLSHARNRAIEACTAPILTFIDDDVLVDPQWLVALASAARRLVDVAAWGGPIRPWYPVPPRPEYLEAFPALRGGFCGHDNGDQERILNETEEIVGANMTYRMSAIGSMRFDVTLGPIGTRPITGDETEFVERLRRNGGRVAWVPQMVVQHYVDPSRMQLGYLLKYTFSQGQSWVRRCGVPPQRRLFGVPRWVWGRTIRSLARVPLAGLSGRRVEALDALRDACQFAGIISACRQISREGGSSAGWSKVGAVASAHKPPAVTTERSASRIPS